MGVLSDETTRLCGEIRASRAEREAAMRDLRSGLEDVRESVSAMQANFRDARTRMARPDKTRRFALIEGLKLDVAALKQATAEARAGVRHVHAEMASRARIERKQFTANLRRTVAGQQRALRADLEGARKAWVGLAEAGPKTADQEPPKPTKTRKASPSRSKKKNTKR